MARKQVKNKQEEIVHEPSSETQQIFDAISNNDLITLKRLYTWSFSSAKAHDAKSDSTQSKLLLAARLGHTDIVHFLLFHKHDYLDLHDFNEAQQNPLIEAINNGFTDVVRVMSRHP